MLLATEASAVSFSSLGQIKPPLYSRDASFEAVEANRMLGKLDLDMGKVRLEMPDASRQIIKPLLDAINRPPDMAEMFENEIFGVARHWPISVK
jgi:hypothetical protein